MGKIYILMNLSLRERMLNLQVNLLQNILYTHQKNIFPEQCVYYHGYRFKSCG